MALQLHEEKPTVRPTLDANRWFQCRADEKRREPIGLLLLFVHPWQKPSLPPTLWAKFFPDAFPTQRGATNVPTLPPTPKMTRYYRARADLVCWGQCRYSATQNDMMARGLYGVNFMSPKVLHRFTDRSTIVGHLRAADA